MRRMNANIVGIAKASGGGDFTPDAISFTAIGTDYYDHNNTNIVRLTGVDTGINIVISYADNIGSFGTNLLQLALSDNSDMSSAVFNDIEGGFGTVYVENNKYMQFYYSGFDWSGIQVYLVNNSDGDTALNDFGIAINN